jgi:valyl-tRNA synthetase
MKSFPQQYKSADIEVQQQQRWMNSSALSWDKTLDPSLDYVIDTPPPTVSGMLHVGHVYSYTQADIIARYFRMSGRNVLYPVGWDDNGLPTERLVEKIKKVRGGTMPRNEFVELCRTVIPEYETQFRTLFSKLALSVDWSREYQTISEASRRISQLSFVDLISKGLIEQRMEPTLWDPADRTAIAQAEVDEIERESKLYTVEFALLNSDDKIRIATTRPELLGGCGAIMIHPDSPRAAELIGKMAITPLYGVTVPIIADDVVDPEKGTGLVMCCTFGDVTDIAWWRRHKLPLRIVLDRSGRLLGELAIGTADWPSVDAASAHETIQKLAGQKTAEARASIVALLQDCNALIDAKVVQQVVPVAERSGFPLEVIVTPQWVIRTLDFKDEILAKGREINWHPSFMLHRFESWVNGLKWDWNISRQRHFGVPIPVWYSKRAGEVGKVIVARAQDLPVDPMTDVPPGYTADEVTAETDVMDTWATSSVSPQLVTRAINNELGEDGNNHDRLFPMSLRPQSHEIIRTWAFYTIVKALHHQNTVPWTNIAVSGWCLASDGSKMSKSKGNIIDPFKLLTEYGTDAVRYWTGTSRLGNDTVLAPQVLQQGKRLSTKLWNAMKLAYLAIEQDKAGQLGAFDRNNFDLIIHPLDQWIVQKLHACIAEATTQFEAYEYASALRAIESCFWQDYCDNYLEICKPRTRIDDATPSPEQLSALATLRYCADIFLHLFAPFQPHLSDALHDILFGAEGNETSTIHARGTWPRPQTPAAFASQAALGDLFTELLAAARKAKSEQNLSIATPLSLLRIAVKGGPAELDALQQQLGDNGRDLLAMLNAERLEWSSGTLEAGAVSDTQRVMVGADV